MAAFHFKYEAVLRQRQAIEDRCQRELATHLRLHHVLNDQLARMRRTERNARHQLGEGLVGTVDLEQVREFARYSGQMTVMAHQAAQRIGEVEQKIASARAELTEAMRQRKAMEVLRDKQYQQWLLEQRRRENLQLDELATSRYARRGEVAGGAGAVRLEVSP